jgi:hypothetical protein
VISRITIEAETPGDSRTMFRLRIDDKAIAEGLTSAQAHLLVGEALGRMTLPRPAAPLNKNPTRGRTRPQD